MQNTDTLFPAARLMPAPWLSGGVAEGDDTPFALHGMGEIFAHGREAAGAALALALACEAPRECRQHALRESVDDRAFLWVQDDRAIRLGGRPCLAGLPQALRHRIVHVAAGTAADALFALEEGVRCRDLAFVIGEIAGNPKEVDFTASRRLVLAAERHGVPLWLVRLDAARDLGAARMRWQVAACPSAAPRWNAKAPGDARWHGELFRARGTRPGAWMLSAKGGGDGLVAASAAPDHGDLVRAAGDRPLATA